MTTPREVLGVTQSRLTLEGAGVRLRRAFGSADPRLDPFLLLDDFGSDDPTDFVAGFPWHPHRGIETITYVLEGAVRHGDSLGNSGVIGEGDVQWMTAGSGIIHEEMPLRTSTLKGFQLWANLPASHKMMAPRYREVKGGDIPRALLADGVEAKVICGSAGGVTGPVRDIVTDPLYLDVSMSPAASLSLPLPEDHNVLAYAIEGVGTFDGEDGRASAGHLVTFSDGAEVRARADDGAPFRFLLVSGNPIGEPVAWGGPIVMNTQEELRQAFMEYEAGTFIKHR